MSRPLRLEIPNGHFHVVSRGNGRQQVFLDDDDRRRFLDLLERNVVGLGWRCLTYCLMGNHYHLLVATPQPNLAEGMRNLNGTYAQCFNKRYERPGHVWQGRYFSQLVQTDRYLRAVLRYVAMNPVRAGLVARAEQWRWSAHAGLLAGRPAKVVDQQWLWGMLDSGPEQGPMAYAAAVAGAGGTDFDPTAPIMGDKDFIREHAPSERPMDPVVKRAWEQARPGLQELREALPSDEFIRVARLEHWYPIAEIAGALGCSRETVRRRLRMWDVRT